MAEMLHLTRWTACWHNTSVFAVPIFSFSLCYKKAAREYQFSTFYTVQTQSYAFWRWFGYPFRWTTHTLAYNPDLPRGNNSMPSWLLNFIHYDPLTLPRVTFHDYGLFPGLSGVQRSRYPENAEARDQLWRSITFLYTWRQHVHRRYRREPNTMLSG